MRPALQRLLGSPSAQTILRNAIDRPRHCPSCWSCGTVRSNTTGRGYSSGSEEAPAQGLKKKSTGVAFRKIITDGYDVSTHVTRRRLGKTINGNRKKGPITSNERDRDESRPLSDVQAQQDQVGTPGNPKNNILSKTVSTGELKLTSVSNESEAVRDGNSKKRNSQRRALQARKPSRPSHPKPSPRGIQSFPSDASWRNTIANEPQLSSDFIERLCIEEQAGYLDRRRFDGQWLKQFIIDDDAWRNFVVSDPQQSPSLFEMLYLEEKEIGNLVGNHSARDFLVDNDYFLPSLREPAKAYNDPQDNAQSPRRQDTSVVREISSLKGNYRSFEGKYRVMKERLYASKKWDRASKERYEVSEERNRASKEREKLSEDRDRASKERYKASGEESKGSDNRLRALEERLQTLEERDRASERRHQALEKKYQALKQKNRVKTMTAFEMEVSSGSRASTKVNVKLERGLEPSDQGLKPKNDGKGQLKIGLLPNGHRYVYRQLEFLSAGNVNEPFTAASSFEQMQETSAPETTGKRCSGELQPRTLAIWNEISAQGNSPIELLMSIDDEAWMANICSDQDLIAQMDPSRVLWEVQSCVNSNDAESSMGWKDCTPVVLASTLTDNGPTTCLVRYCEVQKHLSVPGLHNSLPMKSPDGWKSRLMTIEHYEYESNVHLPASRGPRLVDHDQYASDFELWLELVLFRRRRYDIYALQPLWAQIRARNLDLPTEGDTADLLWRSFVDMGLRCRATLPTVVQYAIDLQYRTNRYWKDLYKSIIHFQLMYSHHSAYAYKWNFRHYHTQLYESFSPTVDDFLYLFDSVGAREHSSKFKMLALQRIYADLSFRNLYAIIIERLYKAENFEAAASWHNVMVTRMDIPTDLQTYRPLFRYMVLYGDRRLLTKMVDNMVRAKIQLPSFIKHPLPISPVSQKLIDKRLAEIHSITPNTISDEFCARIFATAWFSIDTVISMFRAIGLDTLGPLALREIVIREKCLPSAVTPRVRQLQASGIRLELSTYCSLVSRLALEDNARLLENVVHCDLHPETFQDRALQESLLSTYHDNGDQLQIDRTLAILMTNYPEIAMPKAHWNIQLRLRLKQKDIHAVNRILEAMYASEIPVEPMSCNYVRICLLTRRAPGKRPHSVYDLPVIINIWKHVLRAGGTVPPISWIEILRRLGMTGQLEEYEKLALWLAKYYSGSTGDAALEMLPHKQALSKHIMRRLINVPSRLSPMRREHPLHTLFPTRVHQAVVAWGFQHARIGGTNWRWGLHLLLKLKQFNVHVQRETVARACRLRLGILFGTRRPSRLINRRAKASNTAPLEYYFREIEKIAGKSLFLGSDYPLDDEERIKLLLEQFPAWEHEPREPGTSITTPVLLDTSLD